MRAGDTADGKAASTWRTLVRQAHRWLSVAFTLTVIVCFIAVGLGEPPEWLFYLPLFPLALLFLSGAYLFVLPYAGRWRGRRRSA